VSYRRTRDWSSQGRQSQESGAKSNGFSRETHFEDGKGVIFLKGEKEMGMELVQ
jgi:hypothetical protein